MKILLINSPIRLGDPPRNFPIGLGIIANVLKQKGYEARVLDVNAHRYSNSQVLKWLEYHNDVDVIGISGLITTYKFQKWLINIIKDLMPEKWVIAGGGCASSIPEIMIEKTKVDIIVTREGEITLPEVLEAIANGKPLDDIQGIAYRKNDSIKINPHRPLIKDLDSLPFPAYAVSCV